jgi:xanthine dehydrogenase accessory factor
MSELLSVLEALEAAATVGHPAVFCVVLEKRGSAPREPGAAMLVRGDERSVGTVGGGAVEVVTEREAIAMLPDGQARLLTLSLDEDHGQDDASICGGEVAVGLVPVRNEPDHAPFQQALDAARLRKPAQIPITVESAGRARRYRLHVEPPPTLVIVGAGHVGQALARLARPLDFRVVVVDDRKGLASRDRFESGIELVVGPVADVLRTFPLDASSYVAIMTQGHRHDQAALEAVIDRPVAYIGMIGSQRKAATILGAMQEAGVPPERLREIHVPIGLPIGAMAVNEIAVSIAAELVQVRRRSVPKIVEGPLPAQGV